MAVFSGIGRVCAIVGVILLVIVAIIFVSNVGKSTPAKVIIEKTVELRGVGDSVKRAQVISSLDTIVADSGNAALDEQWAQVTKCLSGSCPDDAFFDMVFVAANEFQNDLGNTDLLMNLLIVNRYWGGEDVVEFSRSLSEVDTGIQSLQSRKAKDLWDDIVKCNNECEENNGYYFELIQVITELS